MQQFMDLVSITPWQILATWANLLVLTLLVKKFLFKPVQKIMSERQAAADALIAEAAKAKAEAEALQAQYEAHLANARQEAAQMLENAGKTAAMRSEETLAEARAAAVGLKQKAAAEIEQERKKTLNEVKTEIGGMAMEIASKVVEREIQAADHQALIDKFIKNVGDAS